METSQSISQGLAETTRSILGQISMVQNSSTQLEDLKKEYSEIFRNELGTVRGFQASLYLKGSPCQSSSNQDQCHLQFEMPIGMNLIALKQTQLLRKSLKLSGLL